MVLWDINLPCPWSVGFLSEVTIPCPNTSWFIGLWCGEQYKLGLNNIFPPPHSVQYCSVTQSRLTVCNPMNHSMPGLPVHHEIPEFTQTHVHWVSDAIQPSHPLSFPSPPALNLSQHQGLFNESAFRIRWPKYWSFCFNISPSNEHPRTDFL